MYEIQRDRKIEKEKNKVRNKIYKLFSSFIGTEQSRMSKETYKVQTVDI